jgi:hypothetical protein
MTNLEEAELRLRRARAQRQWAERRLLAGEVDPHKREALNRQLAEQEAELQEMERKERGG